MDNNLSGRIAADLARHDVSVDTVSDILAELLRLNELYGQILSNLPLSLLLVDRRGIVTAATPRVLSNVLGLAQSQVVGQEFAAVAEGCAVDIVQIMALNEAIRAGEAWEGDFAAPGAVGWRLKLRPLVDNGNDCRLMLLLFEDDPALSNAARRLEAARLEKADRFMRMGQLAGTVLHDLKNNLQNIGGYVQLMQLKFADDPKVQDFAGLIANELTMANGLVMDFLGMSRLDMQPVMGSLNDAVREALLMIYGQCHIRQIVVREELCAAMPEIMMDKQRIKQVIFNFVDNSIDAIEERRRAEPDFGGCICITTEYQPDDNDDGGFVHIIFEDDGAGMEQQALDNFFKPFFTTKENGHGMGTSISAAIVHLHGGHIKIKSRPGEGCKIMLSLPCRPGLLLQNDSLLDEIAQMMALAE